MAHRSGSEGILRGSKKRAREWLREDDFQHEQNPWSMYVHVLYNHTLFIYIYICIYIYVCIYIYIHTIYTYIYIYINTIYKYYIQILYVYIIHAIKKYPSPTVDRINWGNSSHSAWCGGGLPEEVIRDVLREVPETGTQAAKAPPAPQVDAAPWEIITSGGWVLGCWRCFGNHFTPKKKGESVGVI